MTETLTDTDTLTDRQAAFADLFAELGNASEAARQAGYSEANAGNYAARLMQVEKIRARVRRARQQRAEIRAWERGEMLARLEAFYTAAMKAGQFNAGIRALTLMTDLLGLRGREVGRDQEEEAIACLDDVAREQAEDDAHLRAAESREKTEKDRSGDPAATPLPNRRQRRAAGAKDRKSQRKTEPETAMAA